MSSHSEAYMETLEEIASGVITANASRVDQEGAFPRANLDALAQAGLLGLVSSPEVGGMGEGIRAAALVLERIAQECSSTAMVLCMHYAGTAVLEKYGPRSVREEIAAGRHLTTLAFSEIGSRSQFWEPVSQAQQRNGNVRLDAQKSWVTSAHHADSYVWSSRPVSADGVSTVWLVPAKTQGLRPLNAYNGLGMRGNDSTPVVADAVEVPPENTLGADGEGLSVMLGTVLPWFNVMNAACTVGLMEGATLRTAQHAGSVHYQHTGTALADLPTVRAYIARMRVKTDMTRSLLWDTLDAIEKIRPDATLRVLECKAAAGELATEVLDMAMRVCGGAAFRKEVGVERYFRDARAATIMGPTTDVLYDFIGKAACGMELF